MRISLRSVSKKLKRLNYICNTLVADYKSRSVLEDQMVLDQWKGNIDPGPGRRFCIFASFDPQSRVADYVFHYVSQLCDLGFCIIFVTTSEQVRESDIDRLRSFCAYIVHRRNVGLDFGSWKIGLTFIPRPMTGKSLLLANDSVYGPLFDLRESFARAEREGYDLWGITDNWEVQYHVQSYFVYLNEAFCGSEAFSQFFAGMKLIDSKIVAINRYEVGLSQCALRAGFKVGALCSYTSIIKHALDDANQRLEKLSQLRVNFNGNIFSILFRKLPDPYMDEFNYYAWIRKKISKNIPLNQNHHFWRILIDAYRCPFMKTGLLRNPRANIPGLHEWPHVVDRTDYDTRLITDHFKRVSPRKA